MWDPDQLAEQPVIIDRLQASGDPLGEWLAIRARLEVRDELDGGELRELRRVARSLRERLGSRLILADDPRLGRPEAVRERGFLIDVRFADATVDRLLELLTRPDAPMLLRLRLRGSAASLRDCVEALVRRGPTHLRELDLDPTDEPAHDLAVGLGDQAEEIGATLIGLFALHVAPHSVALGFDVGALERSDPWSGTRRTTLGRALASPKPATRRWSLERLREHGSSAHHLRSVLLRLLESEPDPDVRAAVFRVITKLGAHAPAMIAVAVDLARDRDDPQLHQWLADVRRF